MAKLKTEPKKTNGDKCHPNLGIPGLENIFKGKGVRVNNTILVTGVPGTGKSIFSLQFIYNGAIEGISGLFIAYEESATMIRSLARSLGFDRFEEFEKKGLITIIEQPAAKGKITSIGDPLTIIKKKGCQRVVLDSLTLFEYIYSTDERSFRKGVIDFLNYMRIAGVTLIATSERRKGNIDNFVHETQDFLFDGLIVLLRLRKGSTFERVLTVLKMRGHDHMMDLYPISIKKGGIEVFPEQIPFSLLQNE